MTLLLGLILGIAGTFAGIWFRQRFLTAPPPVIGTPVGTPAVSRKMPAGLLAAAMAAGYGTHVGQVEVAMANRISEAKAAGADCWNCERDAIRDTVVCAPKPECMDIEAAAVPPCDDDAGPCLVHEPTWICERNDAGADVCRVK